jgi:hypothetical protein
MKDFQLRRFSVIKLGRVRFKVKDVVWAATGRVTADDDIPRDDDD